MGQTVKQNINMGYYEHFMAITVGCTLYGADSEAEYINMGH